MNVKAIVLILLISLPLLFTACGSNPIFAAPTPTVMPTPTNDPLSAAKVVQAFWNALNSGDLDTAMVYVADDVKCAGFCYFKGKVAFQSYLQGYLDAGFTTEISDVRNVGSIVTYSWEAYRNGNFVRGGDGDEVMQVEDGKIVYWENQHR
jgi:hypothetical protein